ncbi:MAG: methyltransferase domain-containing protein [Bacteroidetes bacterium]|nr:methyltransferase domain-containing protein [Bacteroidota bacterium]
MRPYELLWKFDCDGSVISVAGTPNLSTICAGTVGRKLFLLDQNGQPLWSEPYEVDNEIWATAISDDGQLIGVGTAEKNPTDGTLYVLGRDRSLIWSQRIYAPVWGVSFSNSGSILAASTWVDNQVYRYKRGADGYEEHSRTRVPGTHGVYGIRLTANGQLCVVAAYEDGIFVLDETGSVIGRLESNEGFYNLAAARDTGTLFVGTRPGVFWSFQPNEEIIPRTSRRVSERPICGMSSVANGSLVACGSFDGRLLLVDSSGDLVWDYQTKGEVWSTAISSDGSLVVAASGDHSVTAVRNRCTSPVIEEISSLQKMVFASGGTIPEVTLRSLTDMYIRCGLARYGYSQLKRLLNSRSGVVLIRTELKRLLETLVATGETEPSTHFHLGEILAEEKKFWEAVKQFQEASRAPELRSTAQQRAAKCFSELRLNTAATSAWRQSRESHLDDNARSILFILARSFEDVGSWKEAAKIYEMVLSWDADFRNSWEKLAMARQFKRNHAQVKAEPLVDYTGATISLLGPDAPRAIDVALEGVVQARSREVPIETGSHLRVQNIVTELLDDPEFSRGIRRDIGALDYNVQLFLRYDYGLPEDEMKKFLETVNALPLIKEHLSKTDIAASLDIGCATGRYPLLLTRLGFQASGIDIEARSIEYCTKRSEAQTWPRYVCGDACDIEKFFEPKSFDVITCMMGTFDHIPRNKQLQLMKKVLTRLRDDGIVIISVWDTECPHLAYLSIYDEAQKERIRENSRTRLEMTNLLTEAGLLH